MIYLFDVQTYFKEKKLNILPPMGFCFKNVIPLNCPSLIYGANIQKNKIDY